MSDPGQHTDNQLPDLLVGAERRGLEVAALYEFQESAWKGVGSGHLRHYPKCYIESALAGRLRVGTRVDDYGSSRRRSNRALSSRSIPSSKGSRFIACARALFANSCSPLSINTRASTRLGMSDDSPDAGLAADAVMSAGNHRFLRLLRQSYNLLPLEDLRP